MFKKALSVVEPSSASGHVTKTLADTVGRVRGFPTALLVGQEKFLDHLKTYPKEELEKEIAHLKKDPRLKDTIIRIGHGDIVEDYKRLLTNKNSLMIDRVLGALTVPVNNVTAAMTRNNHYYPVTDTVQLYGHLPEVAHHELGHAKDFNKHKGVRGKILGAGRWVEQLAIPTIMGGPMTQFLESNANEEAEKTYKGDMREFRRRLWPARGTYWSALAASLAMLHPAVRERVADYFNSAKTPQEQALKGIGLGLGIAGVGALGGRAFAETRNLFDDGKKQTKKANMNTQEAYIQGFVKRAAEYGYNQQEALRLLKQANPGTPVVTGTAAASAPPAKPGFFQGIKDTFKKVMPGIPTTIGNTAGGYEDLARKFQEQAGG
jgi:hypothetical protein